MAAKSGPTAAVGVEELSALEVSVLKALCLTINTAGSELKYKILDTLSDADFYFPVHRSVFRTLSELHRARRLRHLRESGRRAEKKRRARSR